MCQSCRGDTTKIASTVFSRSGCLPKALRVYTLQRGRHFCRPNERFSMSPDFQINGRSIAPGEPTYIIAELSANHNQDFAQAVKLVEAAKDAGADAIKLQTYTPDTITIDCRNDYFQIKGTLWDGRNLYDLYGEAYTPWDWQPKLKTIAN